MTTITGQFDGNDNFGTLTWTDPSSGEQLYIQGEIAFDADGYYHIVYNEQDQPIYIVYA